MEAALYLSSFNNLHVKYSTGASLFLADLLTRQYNRVHLDEDPGKISDVWAELNPPLSKVHMGAELTPEMIMDLLCASPESEYINYFSKRKF